MSILSGIEILDQLRAGAISIDPLDPDLVNVCGVSVDVRLGDSLKVFDGSHIDHSRPEEARFVDLAKFGGAWHLQPGRFYLASTVEKIGSLAFVPILMGKSTVARCGLCIHQVAGLIEPGFFGQITMEVTCSVPVVIRPGMRIGQVVFETVQGQILPYRGRYQGQTGPTVARPLV